MPEVTFGSWKHPKSPHLRFTSPKKTYSADELDQVIPLIKAAETAAKSGAWVALMLSYEAAPAFDDALTTREATVLPLAWAAVFNQPDDEATLNAAFETGTVPTPARAWDAQISRAQYSQAVGRIRSLIARGDTYQVNYTFPLASQFEGDPLAWYHSLCAAQGADYCAYLDLGRYKVLCLSPELFFERRGDFIRTRPMKGTINRGRWSQEDVEHALKLSNSEKDRAENVMIVDLLRNDLGKISVPGSVNVSKLFEIERYETLWQMTSTVESTVRDGVGLVDVMSALFPCGSITGAPKIRTMEIIRELEPLPRGIYTGTIGYLSPGGDCVFNVAIRTVVLDSTTGIATFGVGGGVTIDSTAEREYDECMLKSSFLTSTFPTFRLIESILLERREFFLLHRHLQRLRASAEYFNFQYSEEDVRSELARVTDGLSDEKWKVRLLLAKSGQIDIETIPLDFDQRPMLRVALADQPVNSNDKFLFHKTTNRAIYDRALAQRPHANDVILFNERGEITESTIANVVLELDGELVTPPQSSGLLAGTFRAQFLEEGKICERVISVAELKQVAGFFLINSVHKWMKATLVE